MATDLLPSDFKDFLRLLNAHRVEYLLIGGYAVIYYGYPRTTGDMDIWIATHPANTEKVSAALQAYGFSPDNVPAAMFQEEGALFRMGMPPLRIEPNAPAAD